MSSLASSPFYAKGLGDFPAEIRLLIFRYVLEEPWDGKIPPLIKALRGQPTLYHECLLIFYDRNIYSLNSRNDWSFKNMSDSAVSTIKHLEVKVLGWSYIRTSSTDGQIFEHLVNLNILRNIRFPKITINLSWEWFDSGTEYEIRSENHTRMICMFLSSIKKPDIVVIEMKDMHMYVSRSDEWTYLEEFIQPISNTLECNPKLARVSTYVWDTEWSGEPPDDPADSTMADELNFFNPISWMWKLENRD